MICKTYQKDIIMNITYDYYRIFYYVAKYGSFTKAAEIIGNSQPNITRAMNNLESQTGLKLFIRNKRGIILTPEGKQLFEHIKVAFFHIFQAEEEMKNNSSLTSGNIVIGVSEIALHEVLLPVLSNFYKKYPNIKIQITNQSTPNTLEALRMSQVQFALVTTPFEVKKPMKSVLIKEFDELLMASENFKELKNGSQSLKNVINYPWISLHPDTATRTYHEKFFSDNGLKFEPQMSVATTDQVLPMIKAGLGIGFVPKNMIESQAGLINVKLDKKPNRRSVCLVTDEGQPLSAASLVLLEAIMGRGSLPSASD